MQDKMYLLNLATVKDSNINFEIREYPDGQQDLFVDKDSLCHGWNVATITSRFNSFNDFELITCATVVLRNLGITQISLNIPYVLGARSDRKFSEGGCSYLVQVVAPIINSLNFEKVYCLDVHSHVAAACINRLHNVSNVEFVTDILKAKSNYVLISPDSGAKEKVYNIAKSLKYNQEIVVCSKRRDISTGRIVSTEIGNIVDFENQDVFIIDDICDGGKTFIEIAKKMKFLHPGTLNLIVTHGIFSQGFEELKQYFDNIYCTNSIKDFSVQFVHQTKII